jgi:hypothetical protein
MKRLLLVLLVLLTLLAASCHEDEAPSRWTRVFGHLEPHCGLKWEMSVKV